MNFTQRPRFKDKFKALSLKFRRSGAAAEAKIRIKAAQNFGAQKQNLKQILKRNSARKQTPQIKSWSKNEIYFRTRRLA